MASRVLRAALLGGLASLATLAEADRKVAHVSPLSLVTITKTGVGQLVTH